jgi:hypothetical protein
MFANKRILKLKTLAIYETISIIIKKGAIANGAPLGKKIFENFQPVLNNPIIFIPIKCDNDKKNVTTKELVIVNEYGINPTKFPTKINPNKKNKVVKY